MKKILFVLFIFCISKPTLTQWVLDYQFSSTGSFSLRGVSIVDTNFIWVTAVDSAYGGHVFKRINSNLIELNSAGINFPAKIVTVDSTRAYLSSYGQRIYYTSNSGTNWLLRLSEDTVIYPYYEVCKDNPNYIVASTFTLDSFRYDKVQISTNGGLNWQVQNIPLTFNREILSISITDIQHVWLGINCTDLDCPDLRYYYTTNGGGNWLVKTFSLISNNVDMDAPVFKKNNQEGFTFSPGFNYYIYKSSNSGINWTSPQLFFTNFADFGIKLYHVDSTLTWYWVTLHKVFKTTNDGNNWSEMTVPPHDSDIAYSADFKKLGNKIYAWICTDKGRLFKLVENVNPIGMNPISTEVPQAYMLFQNYPNPFNPSSNIKFQIPKYGDVKLVVYDALGKEVSTLVNEKLNPGTYEAKFESENLPSGVYFYKLQTAEYIATKKMVLIK